MSDSARECPSLNSVLRPNASDTISTAGFFNPVSLLLALTDRRKPTTIMHEVVHWLQTTMTNEGHVLHWLQSYVAERKLHSVAKVIRAVAPGSADLLLFYPPATDSAPECSRVKCHSDCHINVYLQRFLAIHNGYHRVCNEGMDVHDDEVFIHPYSISPFEDLCPAFSYLKWRVPVMFYGYNNSVYCCVAGIRLVYEGMARALDLWYEHGHGSDEPQRRFAEESSDIHFRDYFLLYKYFWLNARNTRHASLKTFIAMCDVSLTLSTTLPSLVDGQPVLSDYLSPAETFALCLTLLIKHSEEVSPLIWNRDYPSFCDSLLELLRRSGGATLSAQTLIDRRWEAYETCFSMGTGMGVTFSGEFARVGKAMRAWADKWGIRYFGQVFFDKSGSYGDLLKSLFGLGDNEPLLGFTTPEHSGGRGRSNGWMFAAAIRDDFVDCLSDSTVRRNRSCLCSTHGLEGVCHRSAVCHQNVWKILTDADDRCPYFDVARQYNAWRDSQH